MSEQQKSSSALQKTRLGGIKFSEMQAQVSFPSSAGFSEFSKILKVVSGARINLGHLFVHNSSEFISDLCLDSKDYDGNRELLHQAFDALGVKATVIAPVGTLTLFPHGSEVRRFLSILRIIEKYDVPVSTIYSSMSTLCINIGFDLLDNLAELLLKVFELPEGHSPFRYELSELDKKLSRGQGRKTETIAQYSEQQIRIFGSNLKSGLTQHCFLFQRKQLGDIISFLSGLKGEQQFEMIAFNQPDSDNCSLTLLTQADENQANNFAGNQLAGLKGVEYSRQAFIEVLYFHGPHFQDRYGVANTAVKALEKNSISFLSLNCTGTSIYLVTEKNGGSQAQEALRDVFVVP